MRKRVARRVALLLALALLAAAPGSAGRHKRHGNLLMAEGRHEEALAAYREGLADAPEDAELHINAGAALFRLAKAREAAEEFRRGMALASDPRVRRSALYNEGTALLEAGDAAAAAARFRQVLLEDPDDASARRNFEIALGRQEGQPQEQKKEKSGPGEGGTGDKGESTPRPEPGKTPGTEPPTGNQDSDPAPPGDREGRPPSEAGGGTPPQPGGDDGSPQQTAPRDGPRLLTRQEAERLLAAIGQGEKEDLRAALAEVTARPRRAGKPDRDW